MDAFYVHTISQLNSTSCNLPGPILSWAPDSVPVVGGIMNGTMVHMIVETNGTHILQITSEMIATTMRLLAETRPLWGVRPRCF